MKDEEVTIPDNQIKFKRKVGRHDGKDLWHVHAVGGLHLIVKADGRGKNKQKTLGMAPHPAVAQHLAEQMVGGDIEWTALNKAEALPLEVIEPLIPKYMELTLLAQRLEDGQ